MLPFRLYSLSFLQESLRPRSPTWYLFTLPMWQVIHAREILANYDNSRSHHPDSDGYVSLSPAKTPSTCPRSAQYMSHPTFWASDHGQIVLRTKFFVIYKADLIFRWNVRHCCGAGLHYCTKTYVKNLIYILHVLSLRALSHRQLYIGFPEDQSIFL